MHTCCFKSFQSITVGVGFVHLLKQTVTSKFLEDDPFKKLTKNSQIQINMKTLLNLVQTQHTLPSLEDHKISNISLSAPVN